MSLKGCFGPPFIHSLSHMIAKTLSLCSGETAYDSPWCTVQSCRLDMISMLFLLWKWHHVWNDHVHQTVCLSLYSLPLFLDYIVLVVIVYERIITSKGGLWYYEMFNLWQLSNFSPESVMFSVQQQINFLICYLREQSKSGKLMENVNFFPTTN